MWVMDPLQPFLVPFGPFPPAHGIWELGDKSQQKRARCFLVQPLSGKKEENQGPPSLQ